MNAKQVQDDIAKFFALAAPLSRQFAKGAKRSRSLPAFVVRDDRQTLWEARPHDAIMRYISETRGTEFVSGLPPRGITNAAGCYILELNKVWTDPQNDDTRQLSVLAHESAHVLTYGELLKDVPKGMWAKGRAQARVYNVGEIIAETTSYLVSRQYLHHTNAHSIIYVAEYAAALNDAASAFAAAAPHTKRATMALLEALEPLGQPA